MIEELRNTIHIGDRMSNAEARHLLQRLYDKYQIERKARTTDLALFGIITKRSIITKDGQRKEGIKVIKQLTLA